MSYTEEGKCKAHIDRVLKRHGVYYVKPVSNGMGKHGVSDYLCCHLGHFFTIEAKGNYKLGPTPLQAAQMQQVRTAGGTTFLIYPDNVHELDVWLALRKEEMV